MGLWHQGPRGYAIYSVLHLAHLGLLSKILFEQGLPILKKNTWEPVTQWGEGQDQDKKESLDYHGQKTVKLAQV